MKKDNLEKLRNMVESRFVAMHSRPDSTGDAHGAKKTRMIWHEHICSLGMHLTRAMESDGRIYLRDPGTLMEAHWGLPVEWHYIVVPEEVAFKILALGHIP